MLALQVLFLLPLVSSQKVQDMFYRSEKNLRTTMLFSHQCSFPCKLVDEKFMSLEIHVKNDAICPDPLPSDYDLSNDLTSETVYQKPCNTSEDFTVCAYCINKKNKTVHLAKWCQFKYPLLCRTMYHYQNGLCIKCVDLWTIAHSEF